MSNFGRKGRLGNNLFQLASLISIAKKNGTALTLPEWPYQKYFELENVHFSKSTLSKPMVIKEPHFHYSEEITKVNTVFNHDFDGYFQTEKYFNHNVPDLLAALSFKKDYRDSVSKKYCEVYRNPTIAVSIRRGDFVSNKNYAQLPITYYFSALEKYFPNWRKENNVLIFSDDIEYCKMHFENFENVFYSESSDKFQKKETYFNENEFAIEQLCAGSMCDHYIISNSTFSWWIAYLGETSESRIIRPSEIFDGEMKKNNNQKDYFPNRWTPHEAEKIDLSDVTFMIPVSFDHNDRKENLGLNIYVLQNHFNTNFVIMEHSGSTFEYFQNYGCLYMQFDKIEFHRTRMLNEMAKVSKTSIIFNWDADVFISPLQILKAVELLRSQSDMVYPYDGRFARVNRYTYFKSLEQSLDIGIFKGLNFKGTNLNDKLSVGGAVGFKRSSYFKGGGENEKFVAYGPEDVEREVRFTRLGYKVERVKGILYHMDHFKGQNSKCAGNPYDKQNHDELGKIYNLSQPELRDYVNTWPLTKLYT